MKLTMLSYLPDLPWPRYWILAKASSLDVPAAKALAAGLQGGVSGSARCKGFGSFWLRLCM